MHLDAEARLDRIETLRRCQLGALRFESDDERDHLGGHLVTAFGASPVRQQTGEPGALQGALRLVEGRPGDAECLGSLADRNAIYLVASHHLVAYLNQVLRVEERIAGEQGIADGFGIGVEHAVLRQRLALRIPLPCPRHRRPQSSVNINTPLYVGCQSPEPH